jgi:hypothetical protein
LVKELCTKAVKLAADLAELIARFLQVIAYIRGHLHVDGRRQTSSVLEQLLKLELDMVSWEHQPHEGW